MTKNIVSVAAALLSAGALLTGCAFDQPNAGCIVQDASFANWYAKYDLKENQTITEDCKAFVIKGETLGVYKFTDPDKKDSSVLTLRPAGLYSRAALDPCDTATQEALLKEVEGNLEATAQRKEALALECGSPEEGKNAQTAVGKLSDTTEDDFCSTSDWKSGTVRPRPAGQVRPEVAPTASIAYQFNNVRMYSAPDAPGTQLTGDLTYTRDNCTAQYTIRAIWPAVACDPDEKEGSAANCGVGSTVNPDFDVVCDPDLHRCVPAKPIPSFKDGR